MTPGYELISKEEFQEIKTIFNKSKTLSRMGFKEKRKNIYKVKEFEKLFKKKFNSKYALAVTSGTAAIRVALSTLKLKKEDEVITQSFTFVATVEAIIESGAKPVCCEIDNTLNMDPKDLLKKINKNTKAVLLVHMLGSPGYVNLIKKICKRKRIKLIEDTAWGCGGKFNGNYLGTLGEIGCFSFDFAKTITTGEGGMLLFKKKRDYLFAAAWHDHGHQNNKNFPRWEDTRDTSGFNYRMNEMQGAVGKAQLRKLQRLVKVQNINYNTIWKAVKNFKDIKLREIPKNSYISADALIFFMKNKNKALKLRYELLKEKISTKILPEAIKWHFAGEWEHIKFNGVRKNKFEKSRKILEKAVSIPILFNMKKNFPDKVKKALTKVLK